MNQRHILARPGWIPDHEAQQRMALVRRHRAKLHRHRETRQGWNPDISVDFLATGVPSPYRWRAKKALYQAPPPDVDALPDWSVRGELPSPFLWPVKAAKGNCGGDEAEELDIDWGDDRLPSATAGRNWLQIAGGVVVGVAIAGFGLFRRRRG